MCIKNTMLLLFLIKKIISFIFCCRAIAAGAFGKGFLSIHYVIVYIKYAENQPSNPPSTSPFFSVGRFPANKKRLQHYFLLPVLSDLFFSDQVNQEVER